MSFEIIRYTSEHEAEWDSFCRNASNATFLHTRKFLSYHLDRFDDISVLVYESNRLVGVMPAAGDINNSTTVVSHPGATYGGLVHNGWLSGNRIIEAFENIKTYYSEQGYKKLLYKAVPHIYARVPAQDDLYAFFRLNAARVRCDLSSTINLKSRRPQSERRKRGLKKARKSVSLVDGHGYLAQLWKVINENLERKYSARPVHSLDELLVLAHLFPDSILIRCAVMDGKVEAGVVLFCTKTVRHAQYIASSEKGYSVSALDAIFESAIKDSLQAEVSYFDFGTSNEEDGLILNHGLYRFKAEFGGGGVAHEYYELML